MKRIGYLYERIYNIENLYRADQAARKGKARQLSVQAHMKHQDENLHKVYLMLRDKTFRTSPYTTFMIHEPKEREILKQQLRRKFKDRDLLDLLDGIIDSAPGLPIGNYLSQFLANYYLSFFDHWIKERKAVRYYFRYADDIVILSGSKAELHEILTEIRSYLTTQLALEVKGNYQVFPVAARSIDFLGYRFYHTHTLLRKSLKIRMARAFATGKGPQTIAAYRGWAKHCDSCNLLNTLQKCNPSHPSTSSPSPMPSPATK